jgi:importin subunit beta-1
VPCALNRRGNRARCRIAAPPLSFRRSGGLGDAFTTTPSLPTNTSSHPLPLLFYCPPTDRTAEQTLEQYLQENYAAFCGALATIIASEERDFVGRQMACLYFKNTLSAQSTSVQVEKHERWKQLDPKTRTEIKDAILNTLRNTKQPQLPHFCAVAAAQIAVIELPYKEWPTFVSSLAITSSAAAEQVKIAALDCLGYTCEQLATIEEMLPNTPELESGTVDAMLTTIVDGVQPSMPDKMRLAALTALKNSLCYIRKNMDCKDERDFILQAVGAAAGSTDDGVRSLAFQCLDTIAELYYEHLGEYMTAIYNLTTAVIQSNSEEDVKMSAIEVWSTVASMEQEYLFNERQEASLGIPASRSPSPQYIQAAAETLFPMMLQTLAIVDEDADEDSWTLQAAASNCIEVMSLTIEGRVIPLTIPFIQQHIQSPDWKFRDASIVAFMSIQEGPTTEEIGTYVKQSLDTLVAHFNDPSPVVQTSALHCVSAMCKLHFTTLEPPMVHKLLAAFMEKLQGPPVLAASACTGIFNVAQSVGKASQEDVATNVLSEPMMPLMQQLLAVSDRPDGMEHNLRVGSMSAATALVSASARDSQSIFRELLPYIIEKTKSALGMQVVSQEETTARDQTLGQLCGLFQTLYQRMEKQDVMERTPEVMNLLLQVCHLRNGQCLEEAILTMGAVAANIEQDFVVRPKKTSDASSRKVSFLMFVSHLCILFRFCH